MKLNDIAKELGLSTSTVSRIISGKGRTSKETKERVLKYVELHDYRPNSAAQSLAKSRTSNIGVVIPCDAFIGFVPFFEVSLMGICEEASKSEFDIVLTSATEYDIGNLKRLIAKKSVDGVILMRSLKEDIAASFLKESDIPFVTIGTMDSKTITQIDAKHSEASKKLTSILLEKTSKPIGFVLGGMDYIVNINRYKGFIEAYKGINKPFDESFAVKNVMTREDAKRAAEGLIEKQAGTIICGDDNICLMILNYLDEKGVKVPSELQIASLYDSEVLKDRIVPITSIAIDNKETGILAARSVIDVVEGKPFINHIEVEYSIMLRESTLN